MTSRQLLFRTVGAGINAVSYVSPKIAGRLAFHLFSKPPAPNIRPKERAFLDTATRLDISWEGMNIPVYSWGPPAGKVVFCAYGWGYNAGRWRHYVPALTEAGYRVIAFDPPGHGLAPSSNTDYPKMVEIESTILRHIGGCELVLCHSFGGGCLIEALAGLPPALHPKRAVVMAVFSEVKWIFQVFTISLGLRPIIFEEMQRYIQNRSGRKLEEFDVALNAHHLSDVKALLIHDPEDKVTAFRNSQRNHSHWVNSALYAPSGTGHHLGTAGVTRVVLTFLKEGTLPESARINHGELEPLPAMITAEDLASSGGVSDYYT
ncbi:alpha/beta hydrolase [Neolewinella aurantiaca]|uniref:Alpha/beta hydrolase n=1 Tax=Neolewinella aurantiaca TaxID=2602767 RepID=A0A5C7FHV9_9BACT|nr:alpha/beta hydrolase [Neolewinella aurantiaca]TXF89404.1 alpha/beta hydrolase [Neolewinella aurantiaca]